MYSRYDGADVSGVQLDGQPSLILGAPEFGQRPSGSARELAAADPTQGLEGEQPLARLIDVLHEETRDPPRVGKAQQPHGMQREGGRFGLDHNHGAIVSELRPRPEP